MKRLLAILAIVLALPASAGDVYMRDANGTIIGDVMLIDTSTNVGQAHALTGGFQSSGSEKGILRFMVMENRAWHFNTVYFTQSNCPSAGPLYFFLNYDPNNASDITAEGRRAINDSQEWSTIDGFSPPTVRSRIDPFGACVNISPQGLPGNINHYRRGDVIVRTFALSYEAS